MKSFDKITISSVMFITVLCTPITALANSSWHWFSDIRPIYILPLIAVVTILIETAMIDRFGKVCRLRKTALFVCLANLLSYICPYIVNMFWQQTPYYTIGQVIENTPSYTVTIVFLLMTLFAEAPVVYTALRKNTDSKISLIASITVSNLITTLFAAAIERIICRGTYF